MTHQKMIVHMSLLGTGVMAALFCHIETSAGQDIYSATAILRVSPPYTSGKTQPPSPDIMNRRVQNYVKTILCEKVVAEAFGPGKDGLIPPEEKKEILKKHPDIVENLLREVRVRQLPGTDFISISLEGRDRLLITMIVNEIAEAAVEDAQEDTNTAIAGNMQVIQNLYEVHEKGRRETEKGLSQLRGRIFDFPSRDFLVQEQRILSQRKIAIQMELIAAQTQLKNLPAGEKNQERKQQTTKQIKKYKAQLEWINLEVLENTQKIHAYDRWKKAQERLKRQLQMLEKTIQPLERSIMNLRIRMRTWKPLQVYRRALPPDKPIEKIKGRKNKTSL